jgi:hypothetical protein
MRPLVFDQIPRRPAIYREAQLSDCSFSSKKGMHTTARFLFAFHDFVIPNDIWSLIYLLNLYDLDMASCLLRFAAAGRTSSLSGLHPASSAMDLLQYRPFLLCYPCEVTAMHPSVASIFEKVTAVPFKPATDALHLSGVLSQNPSERSSVLHPADIQYGPGETPRYHDK